MHQTHNGGSDAVKEEAMQSGIVARLGCIVEEVDQGRFHVLIVTVRTHWTWYSTDRMQLFISLWGSQAFFRACRALKSEAAPASGCAFRCAFQSPLDIKRVRTNCAQRMRRMRFSIIIFI